MDDAPKPPLVFANRVIRQFVDHLVGEDIITTKTDYTVMRLVFRWCGGSWEMINHGDIVHNRLLATIISAWGGMPGRKHEVELV